MHLGIKAIKEALIFLLNDPKERNLDMKPRMSFLKKKSRLKPSGLVTITVINNRPNFIFRKKSDKRNTLTLIKLLKVAVKLF